MKGAHFINEGLVYCGKEMKVKEMVMKIQALKPETAQTSTRVPGTTLNMSKLCRSPSSVE
jgi:hypothetical protein